MVKFKLVSDVGYRLIGYRVYRRANGYYAYSLKYLQPNGMECSHTSANWCSRNDATVAAAEHWQRQSSYWPH